MKSFPLQSQLPPLFALAVAALLSSAAYVPAQPVWPYGPPPLPVPTTPQAQRNALTNLRSRVDWLQSATRTAPNYAAGSGIDNLWQQFQMLRGSYTAFKATLNLRQLTEGANELAELDAGLDIIQEAFGNYQEDVASGRSVSVALRDTCQVLREAAGLWLQELNADCARLRVGW